MAGFDQAHLIAAFVKTFLTDPFPQYHPGDQQYDMTLDLVTKIAVPVHEHVVSWAGVAGHSAVQTAPYANPVDIDAVDYKNWKCGLMTGNSVVNLNNTVDGDFGVLEIPIDGVGGYTITLGTMFTKKMSDDNLVLTLNADNFIKWVHFGTDIVYIIYQKV